jgi:hypothetical protein
MNYDEVYRFDLSGFLLTRGLFGDTELDELGAAVERLEPHFHHVADQEPTGTSQFGDKYRVDPDTGAAVYTYRNPGLQIVVDDFIGADPAFDCLVGHPKLMHYVGEMVLGPHSITSTEIRYRYKDNKTTAHMGGPIDVRNRYHWVGGKMKTSDGGGLQDRHIDLVNLRMMVALHDIGPDDGPYCLVPGSHKANLLSPYGSDPHKEPGMQGVPMKRGDVLFFTENMRHGGYTNTSGKPRKSIHLMYSQAWVPSQSAIHYNAPMRVLRAAWARYTPAQRAFFPNAEIVG